MLTKLLNIKLASKPHNSIHTNAQLFKITESKDELDIKIKKSIDQNKKNLDKIFNDPITSYKDLLSKKMVIAPN